jgi:hypothetical protein
MILHGESGAPSFRILKDSPPVDQRHMFVIYTPNSSRQDGSSAEGATDSEILEDIHISRNQSYLRIFKPLESVHKLRLDERRANQTSSASTEQGTSYLAMRFLGLDKT